MVGFPFTKMFFLVDNGLGKQLSGTGLAAEYDLVSGETTWYQAGERRMAAQRVLAQKIIMLMPLASPLLIVPVLGFLGGYTSRVSTPAQRLGRFEDWVPVLLGLLIFLAFGVAAVYRPEGYTPCEPPVLADQVTFLEEVYEFSLRHNNTVGEYKTPYLLNALAFGFFS